MNPSPMFTGVNESGGGQTHRQADTDRHIGRMDRLKDRRTDGQTEGRTERFTEKGVLLSMFPTLWKSVYLSPCSTGVVKSSSHTRQG